MQWPFKLTMGGAGYFALLLLVCNEKLMAWQVIDVSVLRSKTNFVSKFKKVVLDVYWREILFRIVLYAV